MQWTRAAKWMGRTEALRPTRTEHPFPLEANGSGLGQKKRHLLGYGDSCNESSGSEGARRDGGRHGRPGQQVRRTASTDDDRFALVDTLLFSYYTAGVCGCR